MKNRTSIIADVPRLLMVWLWRVSAILFVLNLGTSSVFAQSEVRVKVLVAFNRQPGPPEQALVRGVGGVIKYTYRLVPAIAVSLPAAAIDGLRRNPNVTRVEPDVQVRAIDVELDNT